ncbi:MAG: S-isoprenylcysteine methyltransferase [Hoeflea sp.]|uniref:methyltransferase family protein n=1 Tax=Hoeflea sp. TaxID=1940281 RepID=UPI000C117ED1|nr:isoprenylcysteine carboxylmethyltransferase family protein [Hoeflea sp.]PHR20101.1 MAG: S-isoprenylcysteine methyltransferase [Hoeflea sp.]
MLSLPPVHVLLLVILIKAIFLAGFGPQVLDRPEVLWGLVPLIAGLWLLVSARLAFLRSKTTIMTFDRPEKLVTSGPFAFTRNPMYLGFLLLLIGAAVLAGYAAGIVAPLMFFVLARFWYIPFEERAAEEAFGSEYAAYRARTRRWI